MISGNHPEDPVISSIVRLELLAFFQANPYTRDTVKGLSTRLHRPIHQIQEAAVSLAALGILVTSGNKHTVYRLKHGDSLTSIKIAHA